MEKIQESRKGSKTKITSVSVSEEFWDIMKGHNVSGTEVFRAGMGIYLCEIGVKGYVTKTNLERLKRSKEILKFLDNSEAYNKKIERINFYLFKIMENLENLEKEVEKDDLEN